MKILMTGLMMETLNSSIEIQQTIIKQAEVSDMELRLM